MASTNAARVGGELTRSRVLDAAMEVFAAKGFRGGSLEDIAKRAGVVRGAVLYHFGNKEGVLTALLARRDTDVRLMEESQLQSPGSPTADLLAKIRMRSPRIRAALDAMKLAHLLEAEAADVGHPAREWIAQRAMRIRSHFASHFPSGVRAASTGTEIDPDSLAALTLAVITGLESQWLVDPDRIDFDRVLEVYEAIVLTALVEPRAFEA